MCGGSNHYFLCILRFYYSVLLRYAKLSHHFIIAIQSKQTFERLMGLLCVHLTAVITISIQNQFTEPLDAKKIHLNENGVKKSLLKPVNSS